eukprot:gene253-873_t
MESASKRDAYDNIIYFQDNVMKKEGLSTWLSYWAVIRGRWMLFYEETRNGAKPTKLLKTIELSKETNCSLMPRKKRRFPFSLDNGHGTYHFKCETELQRYCWIFCTLLASTSSAPKPTPKKIPKNFQESIAYPKMEKFKQKLENSNKKLENRKDTKKDKMGSRRREKYADRLEVKAGNYLSRSHHELRTGNDDNSSDDEHEKRRALSARSARQYERSSRRASSSDVQKLRRTSSHSSVEIYAQIHSPVRNEIRPKPKLVASSSPNDDDVQTLSIIEIEDNPSNTVHVIQHIDALPNMVVDDDSHLKNGSLSARDVKENSKKMKMLHPGHNKMIHSHSMTDLGKSNLGMNIDDEHIIVSPRPLHESNRSRTGLSGMASPRLSNNRKHAAEQKTERDKAHSPRQEVSPRSPVPKSRYSRYNIPSSDA